MTMQSMVTAVVAVAVMIWLTWKLGFRFDRINMTILGVGVVAIVTVLVVYPLH